MRHILARTFTFAATFVALAAPSIASAQWEVRPAPPSWGLPQTQPSAAAQQRTAPQQQGQAYSRADAPPLSSVSLGEAVACSAALQLATMAAPNWARERGITTMTNAWLQKVFVLGESQGVTGDKVPSVVEAEMQNQINAAAGDPAMLSRKAFDCASKQPS